MLIQKHNCQKLYPAIPCIFFACLVLRREMSLLSGLGLISTNKSFANRPFCMGTVNIKRALPSDHCILTEITMDGKAFWGYSKQQLEIWQPELTITAKYISENETYQLVLDNEIIGYYAFIKLGDGHSKLDYLFLFQQFIGKGFG